MIALITRLAIALAVAVLGLGLAPATASAVTEQVQKWDTQESCGSYGVPPPCRDFIGDVTLEPIDGGMKVSWTRGEEDFTVSLCGPPGHFGPKLGNCYIKSQAVISSFDPVTQTGAQWCAAPSSDELSCTITGLRNGVQYAFRFSTVVGSAADGSRAIFTPDVFYFVSPETTTTASPCCSIPEAPADVVVSAVESSVDVSWSAPPDWGGSSELTYDLSTTPGSGVVCQTNVLACRLENVPRGREFQVQVTASNSAGASPPALSSPITLAIGVPGPVTSTRVKYTKSGAAKVNWTPPSNDGGVPITGYTVEAAPGQNSCTTKSSSRSCKIAGLKPGRAYRFTVTAVNDEGAGPPSIPAVAGVLKTPASAPRDPRASLVGPSAAQITWTKPASTGGGKILSYTVTAGQTGPSCTTRRTTCTLSNLALGRTYTITTRALTSEGSSRPAITQISIPAPQATPPKPTQELS